MRRTCAARLVPDGIPIRTVCELLRRKDIGTTMRYAHLAPVGVELLIMPRADAGPTDGNVIAIENHLRMLFKQRCDSMHCCRKGK